MELQDELVAEQINAKLLHKRGVTGTHDGEILTEIYTCKYRDDVAELTDMNSCATAYLSTSHSKWVKDNSIHIIYGEMVIRVFHGGYENIFLDRYIDEVQGHDISETLSNMGILKSKTT